MRIAFAASAAALLAAPAFTLPAFAAPDPTGPGFDCAKASTKVEKFICDTPEGELAWYDRQLSKVYGLLRQAADDVAKAELKDGQTDFLKRRDKCGEDWDCLRKAYRERLDQLAGQGGDGGSVGFFASGNGSLDLAIYPDGLVAFSVSTVGGGDHTCGFSTNAAREAQNGDYVWSANPDPQTYAEACTLTISPQGATMSLLSRGESCTYFCGMRATLDGEFSREAP